MADPTASALQHMVRILELGAALKPEIHPLRIYRDVNKALARPFREAESGGHGIVGVVDQLMNVGRFLENEFANGERESLNSGFVWR